MNWRRSQQCLAIVLTASVMAGCSGGSGDGEAVGVGAKGTCSSNQICPVANAGPDQSVLVGSQVTLDGDESTSASGLITYAWTLKSKPKGSTATLAGRFIEQ